MGPEGIELAVTSMVRSFPSQRRMKPASSSARTFSRSTTRCRREISPCCATPPPGFRDANTAARLSQVFSSLAQQGFDLSGVATMAPQLAEFGWLTLKEAERYTQAARRKRMARLGMGFLIRQETNNEQNFPTSGDDDFPTD